MSCSANAVTLLNKKHGVRHYARKRSVWTTLVPDSPEPSLD